MRRAVLTERSTLLPALRVTRTTTFHSLQKHASSLLDSPRCRLARAVRCCDGEGCADWEQVLAEIKKEIGNYKTS